MNEQTFGKDCKYFVRNESLNTDSTRLENEFASVGICIYDSIVMETRSNLEAKEVSIFFRPAFENLRGRD